MRRLVAVGTFPALLGWAVLAGGGARASGGPDVLAVGVVLLVAAAVLLVLQRATPAVPAWCSWARDAPLDLAHTALSSFGAAVAARGLVLGGVIALSDRLGGGIWPSAWPVAV